MDGNDIFVPNNKLQKCDPADADCGLDDLLKSDICTYVLRTGNADPLYMPRPCGRQSWRQVR
ncbi:hypothetical protein QT383_09325 [Stenotrophomonas rhizophila]